MLAGDDPQAQELLKSGGVAVVDAAGKGIQPRFSAGLYYLPDVNGVFHLPGANSTTYAIQGAVPATVPPMAAGPLVSSDQAPASQRVRGGGLAALLTKRNALLAAGVVLVWKWLS